MENEIKAKKHSAVFEVMKAVIIAIIISLVGVLLAALVIKLFNLSTTAIPIINQVIKSISVLVSCLIALKTPHNCWIKGIISGLIYTALAYVIFSLLAGKFTFDIGLLNDAVVGVVSGFLSGVIAANIRK